MHSRKLLIIATVLGVISATVATQGATTSGTFTMRGQVK